MAQAQELGGAAVKLMYLALAMIGSDTEYGQALSQSAQKIGKLSTAQGGAVGDKNALDALRLQQHKMAPAEAAMAQGGAQQMMQQPQPPAAMGGAGGMA